jgi:hypothetical protein
VAELRALRGGCERRGKGRGVKRLVQDVLGGREEGEGADAQNADNEKMDATSERELSAFIGDAMVNRAGPHKIMKIGNISETVQNFIKENLVLA